MIKPLRIRALLLQSLRFHARAHLGVVLGAVAGTAALVGALVVGDSVRGSLREMALERLGKTQFALAAPDRFFRADLANRLAQTAAKTSSVPPQATGFASILSLPATASAQNGSARANHVQVLGISEDILALGGASELVNLGPDAVALNEALATQLNVKPGDSILLRVRKPGALSEEAVISPRNQRSQALRLKVQAIVPAGGLGNFNLAANQTPPFNAFVRLDALASQTGVPQRANLLLSGPVLMPPGEVEYSSQGRSFHPAPPFRAKSGAGPAPSAEGVRFLNYCFKTDLSLGDLELELVALSAPQALELRSTRIFLDPSVVRAALPTPETWGAWPAFTNAAEVLTYFVNELRTGERSTPYSMVTAIGAPLVPTEMRDDETLINQWLADDLRIGPGADLALSYFLADSGARLVERTNHFRVRGIVPMSEPYADRALMPDFPGLAKAESTHTWDAGFELVHPIRDKDEQYWKEYRGTPKAFVTLAAGQKMWANRFGALTAIRFPISTNYLVAEVLATPGRGRLEYIRQELERERPSVESDLLNNIRPEEMGLRFEPVRAQALAAANQAQDFGQLFLGFSFFLIVAALILMALLFQFGLEQRAAEVGTLLALGWTPNRVRRLFLQEGLLLALVGGVIGVGAGVAYARALLLGLATIWQGAVGAATLRFHCTSATVFIGALASVAVSAITLWLVLRKQARRPARELLAEGAEERASALDTKPGRRPRSFWLAMAAAFSALAMVGWALWKNETADAETFFSAGTLFLIAGVAFAAVLLALLGGQASSARLSISSLGFRGCARRSKRSLATVGLLASGSFLIIAIGAFHLDADAGALKRSSGTGGFALIGESSLPIVQDLNSKAGREFFGLNAADLDNAQVVALRVRDGDEASCLNLNRAQTPRLLGVNPRLLEERAAFTFARLLPGLSRQNPWSHLQSKQSDGAIPAVGDMNSIVWAMGKKIGDTMDLVDEHGKPFKVRLIGGLANSILQGSLLISEEEFVRRFPGQSGYRMFLIDAPSNHMAVVRSAMTRALQDAGLELTPASRRLAEFNAVQNTYLKTFQVLGGLGLLLGSAGLGVVVLRNVLERRGELALLRAVGFRRRALHWLVLSEHAGLLAMGLGIGAVAALVAILPVLLAPGAEVHYFSLAATLFAVLLSGLLWTWLATRLALRGDLLKALRNE